jgi:hypothetical protein
LLGRQITEDGCLLMVLAAHKIIICASTLLAKVSRLNFPQPASVVSHKFIEKDAELAHTRVWSLDVPPNR